MRRKAPKTALKYRAYQIDAPHFCAGVFADHTGFVVLAAPILQWTVRKRMHQLESYCAKTGWTITEVKLEEEEEKADMTVVEAVEIEKGTPVRLLTGAIGRFDGVSRETDQVEFAASFTGGGNTVTLWFPVGNFTFDGAMVLEKNERREFNPAF